LELTQRLLEITVPITPFKSNPLSARMPLSVAVASLQKEMIALLLRYGADPHATDTDYRRTIDYLPSHLNADEKSAWNDLFFG
jgi:hypothetical protein